MEMKEQETSKELDSRTSGSEEAAPDRRAESDGNGLPEWLEKEVNRKVEEVIGKEDYWGRCHTFWRVKKQILRDEYGIDWKTPAEEYPTIIFD